MTYVKLMWRRARDYRQQVSITNPHPVHLRINPGKRPNIGTLTFKDHSNGPATKVLQVNEASV